MLVLGGVLILELSMLVEERDSSNIVNSAHDMGARAMTN